MLRFSLSLLFVLFFLSSQGQIIVHGKVTDINTGKALLGVDVYTENNDYGTATDFAGEYQLALPAGFYELYFSLEGYRIEQIEVETAGSDSIELNVALSSGLTSEHYVGIHTQTQWSNLTVWEEAGRSVALIKEQDRRVNNIVQQDELLPKLSGVQAIDGQVSIRSGAGYTPGVNSRVALLYKGLNLTSPGLSEMPWAFMPNGRIELLKGAASVLYGSGALNGAVGIIPELAPAKGTSETRYSLYSSYYDLPSINSLPLSDSLLALPFQNGAYFSHATRQGDWSFSTQGQFQFRQGYIEGLDERRIRSHSNIMREWSSEGEALNATRYRLGCDIGLMYNERPNFFSWDSAGRFFPQQALQRQRASTLFFRPHFTAFHNTTVHRIRGYSYQHFAHQDSGTIQAYTASHLLQYEWKRQFASKTSVSLGANGQYFAQQSPRLDSLLEPNASDVQRWGSSAAAYLWATQELGQSLKVSFGSRWELFYFPEELYLPELPIFSANFNWRASRSDFFRGSWAQGYRMPSLEERYGYFEPTAGLARYPNPELQMERGWTAELGYKKTYRIGDWYAYSDLALFWMEYDNLIQEQFGTIPNLLTADTGDFWNQPGLWLQNVGAARIAGADLSLFSEGSIGEIPLRIWGGYTFSYPEQRDSNTAVADYLQNMTTALTEGVDEALRQNSLPYRNLHTFRLDIQSQLGPLSLGTALNYQSALLRVGDFYQADGSAAAQALEQIAPGTAAYWQSNNEGQWRIDARLGWRWNDKTHLSLIVNNILNEPLSYRPGRLAAPRSFTLKLSHHFDGMAKLAPLTSDARPAGGPL